MSSQDLSFCLVALSAVFFVVDPLLVVPIFLSITAGDSVAKRRETAARASLMAFATLALFALAGGFIFAAFGISLGAFKIAGGLLLFLTSIDMMRAQPARTRSTEEEQAESAAKEDVAIIPVAIPMLAGPGSIATVMVLMSRAAWQPVRTVAVFIAILITCAVAWLLMRSAILAERFLTRTSMNVAERVMGLLLAAIAVEFVVGGIRDLFPSLAR
ncbi:MAG TPA: MarC family protein [Kofleriaceae bacterium]|nr:MarC family protein [Kofleriaceae bacterium]